MNISIDTKTIQLLGGFYNYSKQYDIIMATENRILVSRTMYGAESLQAISFSLSNLWHPDFLTSSNTDQLVPAKSSPEP